LLKEHFLADARLIECYRDLGAASVRLDLPNDPVAELGMAHPISNVEDFFARIPGA
jgi:hypothetical protein